MQKKGLAHQVTKVFSLVVLMQLMFVAFQGLQVSSSGLEYTLAKAHADVSSTNLGMGAGNPFATVGDKATGVYEGLRFAAIGLMTLAIGASAIFMFKGRMNPTTFLWILGGGILFGAAPDIAKFFMNK